MEDTIVSELRQPLPDSLTAGANEPLIAVPMGNGEVRYFKSDEEVDKAFGQSAVQRGLDLAGAWSELGISEDEMQEALDRIRHESEPTPPIDAI